MKSTLLLNKFIEYWHKSAICNQITDSKIRQAGNSQPSQGKADARFYVIAHHRDGKIQIIGIAQWPFLKLTGM